MASDTLLGRELTGYLLERELGRGAMGVCYLARDPELSRPVALKLIAPAYASDPDFRARFLSEIELAAALEHPHVCPLYRAGEAEGELFVCMRYLEGGSLAARVAAQGALPTPEALALLTQLASALDHAHARGLCHGDVSAANVLLDEAGHAYLTDFGLAAPVPGSPPAAAASSSVPLVAGTLAYLAPERWQGAPASPASDLYALACLAYQLLAGEVPFRAEHEAGLLYAHLREAPPTLSAHGRARLDPAFAQALAKDPFSRPQSCGAFADALAEALEHPEPGTQLVWPDTLPRPVTSFLGRERELRELEELLAHPQTRLLTLTGPGGTGKTRLALQAAAESADAFSDGVHWLSLAPLRDPGNALSALAQALEISEQPGTPLRDTLAEALSGRECLICLDNCEHLLPELADDVAQLRDLPAGPTMLCTSRERLELQAERLYPVPPLQEAEAIELFCERAAFVAPTVALDDPALPAFCARLDFLPLALELAAARSDLYTPGELLAVLAERLDLLTGPRDSDPRHRTLEATIAWSYDLLSPAEQSALRGLSVFAGGCTAEAAGAVAGAGPEILYSLVAKSLLRTRDVPSGRRYWMLETIRQYAAERLAEAGEEGEARERHAACFAALAAASEELLSGSPDPVDRLRADDENLRAAIAHDWGVNPVRALMLLSALRVYWWHAGGSGEADLLLSELLERDLDLTDEQRARALVAAGTLAWMIGDLPRAARELEAGIITLRVIDEPRLLASALNNHGNVTTDLRDFDTAEASLEECAALFRGLGDTAGYAGVLGNLASTLFDKGETARASSLLLEALELQRASGTSVDVALVGLQLAEAALAVGEPAEARTYALEGLELLAGHEVKLPELWLHTCLSRCEGAEGRHEAARAHLRAALAAYRELEAEYYLRLLVDTAAEYAVPVDVGVAARLLGRSDAVFAAQGVIRLWYDLERRERLLDRIVEKLGAEETERGLEAGGRLSTEEALARVEHILDALPPPDGP